MLEARLSPAAPDMQAAACHQAAHAIAAHTVFLPFGCIGIDDAHRHDHVGSAFASVPAHGDPARVLPYAITAIAGVLGEALCQSPFQPWVDALDAALLATPADRVWLETFGLCNRADLVRVATAAWRVLWDARDGLVTVANALLARGRLSSTEVLALLGGRGPRPVLEPCDTCVASVR